MERFVLIYITELYGEKEEHIMQSNDINKLIDKIVAINEPEEEEMHINILPIIDTIERRYMDFIAFKEDGTHCNKFSDGYEKGHIDNYKLIKRKNGIEVL